jgi:hypothetical protein
MLHADSIRLDHMADRVRTLRRQARDWRAIAAAYRVQRCSDAAARFEARAEHADSLAQAMGARCAQG